MPRLTPEREQDIRERATGASSNPYFPYLPREYAAVLLEELDAVRLEYADLKAKYTKTLRWASDKMAQEDVSE